ncbi:MAG TPA: hypothetical protein VK438_19940 [Xanthobacteraceae bacterium]|nr:hypothetical protein [Xanthobacteraceae bacterium]
MQRRSQTHAGHAQSAFFSDGMIITLDQPDAKLQRGDTLNVRTPDGELLEIIPAGMRQDGAALVWYAPHPLLRHWLGRMERVDPTRWRLRMEPYHVDILRGIPALCEDVAQIPR